MSKLARIEAQKAKAAQDQAELLVSIKAQLNRIETLLKKQGTAKKDEKADKVDEAEKPAE